MIYHNGHFITANSLQLDATDRGLLLGDGLFETLRADHGKVFYIEQHWQRLQAGASILEIPIPISFEDLKNISLELLQQNDLLTQIAFLRLTLTRGGGPQGLLPAAEIKPTLIVTAGPLSTPLTAVNAAVVAIQRNELSVLSSIKSLNYLENILAKMAAKKLGANEAILFNSKNFLAEASAANVFLVDSKGQLLTPRIEDGALPGITRAVVKQIAKDLDIPLIETALSAHDLFSAAEIFLTNSLIGVQQVKTLNSQLIVNSNHYSRFKSIQAEYQNSSNSR